MGNRVNRRGEDVPIFAAKQADKQAEAGDMEGQVVWLRVLSAVEELQRAQPRRDEPTH